MDKIVIFPLIKNGYHFERGSAISLIVVKFNNIFHVLPK